MSSRSHRQGAIVAVNRPNEGALIDIAIRAMPSVDGSVVGYMGADLSKAPVPDRKFAADWCALIERDYLVNILFGQQRADGKGLRSLVVVQMSEPSAFNYVKILSDVAGPSYMEIATTLEIPTESLSTLTEEPAQALTLSANMALSAMSGPEACIDFYKASPFAMGVAMRSNKLSLDPVVRVDFRSSLFMALYKHMLGRENSWNKVRKE
jgi:hypothetical protein